MGILDPELCQQAPSMSFGVAGAVCSSGDWATVVWNQVVNIFVYFYDFRYYFDISEFDK